MSGMTFSSNLQEVSFDFLSQSIILTQELLSDILYQINGLPSVEVEREFFWNQNLAQLTLDIGQFVELTTLLSKLIMKTKNRAIPEIKNSHIHLLFILKGIKEAQQKLDHLALEELIKYELKDNLTQWKIDLIPQTRRLLNS